MLRFTKKVAQAQKQALPARYIRTFEDFSEHESLFLGVSKRFARFSLNKPGTAQVGAPLKAQKCKVFYICKSTFLLKFHQFYSALYRAGYA